MAGELQCLVNEATAAQDAAIVRLAAVEPQWCEDGTLIEVHQPLGHGALDAPAVLSGVLGLTAVAAERRVRHALRTAADGPDGTESCTGLGGLHAAMASGVLDAYRAQVVAAELEECPPEVAATVVASLEGWFGARGLRPPPPPGPPDAGADQPGPAAPARTACPVGVEPAAVGRRTRRRHLARDVPVRGGVPGMGRDRRARAAVRHRRHLRTHRPGPRQGAHRPRHRAGDRRRPGRPHRPRLDQPGDQPRSRRGRRAAAAPSRSWSTGAGSRRPDEPGSRRATRSPAPSSTRASRWRPARTGPAKRLAALVRARDGRCRFPGCHVAARFCDLDHVTPWPAGPTTATNLACLCRRHHRVKQRPGWTATLHADAPMTWTDPHRPHPHHPPRRPPPPHPPSPPAAPTPNRTSPRASPASPSPTHPTAPSNTATNTTSAPPDPAPPAAPTPTTSPHDGTPPPSPPRTGDPATAGARPPATRPSERQDPARPEHPSLSRTRRGRRRTPRTPGPNPAAGASPAAR